MADRPQQAPPVGAVLAGGLGRRIGGDKAVVELEGRPLIRYVLETLHEVCDDVVVVAKRDTMLPGLRGQAALWIEPDEPRHPLTGVAHALRLAAGRAVLAVAVDLPLIDAATLRGLVDAEDMDPARPAAVVVPRVHGRLQPLCALYRAAALDGLASFDAHARASDVVEALGALVVEPPDAAAFLNVNRPEDLLQASALLQGVSPR